MTRKQVTAWANNLVARLHGAKDVDASDIMLINAVTRLCHLLKRRSDPANIDDPPYPLIPLMAHMSANLDSLMKHDSQFSDLSTFIRETRDASFKQVIVRSDRALKARLTKNKRWTRGLDGRLVGVTPSSPALTTSSAPTAPSIRNLWTLPSAASGTTPPKQLWISWIMGAGLTINTGRRVTAVPSPSFHDPPTPTPTPTALVRVTPHSIIYSAAVPPDCPYLWLVPSVSGVHVAPMGKLHTTWTVMTQPTQPTQPNGEGGGARGRHPAIMRQATESLYCMAPRAPRPSVTVPHAILLIKAADGLTPLVNMTTTVTGVRRNDLAMVTHDCTWINRTGGRAVLASVLIYHKGNLNAHELQTSSSTKPSVPVRELKAPGSGKSQSQSPTPPDPTVVMYCTSQAKWRGTHAVQHVGLCAGAGRRWRVVIRTYGEGEVKLVPNIYSVPEYDIKHE